MRLVLLLVTLLALSALLALPASAETTTSMDGCDMSGMTMSCHEGDATTIQSLRHCVEHAYEMGHITQQGVAKSLLKLVDAAQSAADRGNTAAAVASLEAFVALVQSQSGLAIDEMHADCLATHAEMVIQALRG